MTDDPTVLRSVPAPGGDIEVFAARWRRAMRDKKTPRTIKDYMRVLSYFDEYLVRTGAPRFVGEIERDHIEEFKLYWLEATHPDGTPYEPNTARVYVAVIKSFFRWLTEDIRELDENPAERVKLPHVPVKIMPVPERRDVEALLATTRGRSFVNRRDRAILGFLMSSGTRETGTANIKLRDVHLDAGWVAITLKGGDEHKARMDSETVRDFDNYLAVRAKHPYASSPYLWLGPRGRMTGSGLYQMIVRRSAEAGVKITPHDYRRFVASELFARGASEGDAMTLIGWKDPSMARRYAAATAGERAAETHARLNPRAKSEET